MRVTRAWLAAVAGLSTWAVGSAAGAQTVVINEVVKEQRTAGSGAFDPDTREFIELYNPTAAAVNIGGWSLLTYDLAAGSTLITDTIPGGTMLGPGDYFVIGAGSVPNVDFTPPGTTGTELYPDNLATVLELQDGGGATIDAVAYEVFRTGASGLTLATTDQLAQVGSGFQGQLLSMNASSPNTIQSWGRYRDGIDTNSNGRDFGVLPATPGASNNLTMSASHAIPDVDGLSVGSSLSSEYYASFVLPRVIDPTAASSANPKAITPSPQGGNAIIAWDETGGGNAVYSKQLVSSYDLYAYLNTAPIGVTATSNDEEWESTAYGIGTTDAFFGNPDPTGGIFVPGTITQNASSGIGWMYQRYEEPTGAANFQKLVLVDFGDGGQSTPDAGEWTVIEEIDVSGLASGWFRLSLDYDASTGDVTARFGDDVYTFTTDADLVGNFFVGYREALTSVPGVNFAAAAPPIYDLFEATAVEDADFDDSGTVDGGDFLIWQRNLGINDGSAGNDVGDANGDGNVTDADLAIWSAAYGTTTATATAGAVPEPASAALALLAATGVAVAAGRRRRA